MADEIKLPQGATLLDDSNVTLPKGAVLISNNGGSQDTTPVNTSNQPNFTISDKSGLAHSNPQPDTEDIVKSTIASHEAHVADLNKNVQPQVTQNDNPETVNSNAKKAFINTSLMGDGVHPYTIDKVEDSTLDTNLGLRIPTVKNDVKFDNNAFVNIAGAKYAENAQNIFDSPDKFTETQLKSTQEGLQGFLTNKINELQSKKEALDVAANKDIDFAHRTEELKQAQDAKDQSSKVNDELIALNQQLTDLGKGFNQALRTKAFSDNFNDPKTIDSYSNMDTEDIVNNVIKKQALVSSTSLNDYLDKSTRPFLVDGKKAYDNQKDFENYPDEVKNNPLAVEMLTGKHDIYKMGKLQRDQLGYEGVVNTLNALAQSSLDPKSPENTLVSVDKQLADLQDQYKQTPSQDLIDKYNDLLTKRNDYLNTTVLPKVQLAKKLEDIIKTRFPEVQEQEYTQKQVDALNDKFLGNVYYGTLVTAADVAYNELVQNGKGLLERTGNRIDAATGFQTPEQETTSVNYLKDRIQNAKFTTPQEWQSGQLFEWKDDGFKIHPGLFLHSSVKTGLESYLLGATGVGGGVLLEGVIGDAATTALEATGSFGNVYSKTTKGLKTANHIGEYGAELFGMSLGTGSLYGHDMMSSEEAKGLTPKDAYNIGLIRSYIEGQTEKMFFDEVLLIKGQPISESTLKELRALPKKEILERVERSYQALFSKGMSDGTKRLLYDTPRFLKEGSKVAVAEALEENAGDLGNHILDNQIQANIDKNYKSDNPFDVQNEFLTAINTMATMILPAIGASHQEHNNMIQAARYTVSNAPQTHINNISANFKSGKISEDEAIRQTQLITSFQVAKGLSKPTYDAIVKSDMSGVEKDRLKIQVFNNNLDILQVQDFLSKPIPDDKREMYLNIIQKKTEANNKASEDAAKDTNTTPKQKESKRVSETSDFIDTQFSDIQLLRLKSEEDINKLIQVTQANIKLETNPTLKDKYTNVLDKLNNRLRDINSTEAEYQTNLDFAKQNLENLNLTEQQVSLLPKEELNKVVSDYKGTSETSDKQHIQKLEEINQIEDKEERKKALYDYASELSSQKSPLAKEVEDKYNTLDDEIQTEKESNLKIEALDNTYKKGDFVKLKDGTFWKIQDATDDNRLKVAQYEGDKTTAISDPKDIEKVYTPDEAFAEIHKLKAEKEQVKPTNQPTQVATETTTTPEKPLDEQLKDLQVQAGKILTDPSLNISDLDSKLKEIGQKQREIEAKMIASEPVIVENQKQEQKKQEESIKQVEDAQKEQSIRWNPLSTVPSQFTAKGLVTNDLVLNTQVKAFDYLKSLISLSSNLAKEGFFVTVMNNNLPMSQQLLDVQESFNSGTLSKERIEQGKIAVITDKEGKPHLFNEEGKPSDKGLPVYQNLAGRIVDGELVLQHEPSELTLRERNREEAYKLEKERLKSLRLSDKSQTFEIAAITPGVTIDKTEAKVKLSEQPKGSYSYVFTSKGLTEVKIDSISYPAYSPTLGKAGLTDNILALLDLNNKEGLLEELNSFEARRSYIEAFLYTALDFRRIAQINNQLVFKIGEGNKQIVSQDKVKNYLNSAILNIDRKRINASNFNTYTWDGTKFNEATKGSYKDFLAPLVEVKKTTKTTVNSYVKFGLPVETKPTEQAKTVQEPKKNITIEPGVQKESPKEFTKKKRDIKPNPNLKGLSDISGSEELKRSKLFRSNTTEAQETKAKEWFDKYLKLTGTQYEDFRDIVNSDAVASYFNGTIKLWKGGKYSDLYHEAFHNFTQLHLTKTQKQVLYSEAASSLEGKKALIKYATSLNQSVKELSEPDKFFSLEEMLAEDFYKYQLSNQTLILNNRVNRNSIFRKMFNFLKELFTGSPSLETIYSKLANNNISSFKADIDNAYFGNLNKNVPGLDFDDSYNLRKALDSLLAKQFRDNNLAISFLFKDKKYLDGAYNDVYNTLATNYDTYEKEYNDLVEKYNNAPEEEKQALLPEISSLEKLVDNLNTTIQSWEDVRKNHLTNSNFLKVSQKFIPEELLEGSENSSPLSKDDIYDDKEGVSAKDKASKQLLYLIATLPQYVNEEGLKVPKKNAYLDIIEDTIDFEIGWNKVAKALTGIRDYDRQYQKLQSMTTSNPEFNELLQSLPHPKDDLNLLTLQLRNQFIATFSQPLVPLEAVSMWYTDKGELRVQSSKAISTSLSKLQDDWNDAIQQFDNPYRLEDKSTLQKEVNLSKIIDDFSNISKKSKSVKQDFLDAIGFTFSDNTRQSPEFQELLNSNKLQEIYSSLKQLSDLKKGVYPKGYELSQREKEAVSKPVYSIIDAISNTFYGRNDTSYTPTLVKGIKETIENIADLELSYSDKFFSDNLLNSEGNSVYAIRPWSQQTVLYNMMNDVEKFPDLKFLISTPLGAYFDTEKNPDANNAYTRALFNLETGERNLDKSGKPVTIDLYNHNGLQVTTKDNQRIGKKTISLTRFEKLTQDIAPFLLSGAKEHIRYGDKSTSHGTKTTFSRFSANIVPENPYLPSDIRTYRDSILPDEAWNNFREMLQVALQRTNDFYSKDIGKDWDNYNKNINDWAYFDGILSKKTQDLIKSEGGFSSDNSIEQDIPLTIAKFQKEIKEDLSKFLQNKVYQPILDELNSNTAINPEDYLPKYLIDRYGFETLIKAFAVNSYIVNAEHTRLMFQDVRFYANKNESYRESFKRFSKSSSIGKIAINDDQTNNYLTTKPRQEQLQYNKENPENQSPDYTETGVENSIIFNDFKITPTQFLDEINKVFKDSPKEERLAIAKKYTDITTTDAMGMGTFDWYRNWEIRTGNDNWNNEKEALYNKIARKQALTEDEIKQGLAYFPPKKIRVTGYSFDQKTNQFIPIDYKFAVTPLLYTVVNGKSLEIVKDNMLRQNVSIATFKSASKHSAVISDGTHNSFYNKDGSVNTSDYTLNPIHTEFMYEVVASPEDYKEKVTYPTQKRDLLFSDLFENGLPIDYKGKKDFNQLSEKEKNAASDIYKKYNQFTSHFQDYINQEKENLLHQLNAKDNGTSFTIDDNRLSDLLEREFDARGLPQNVLKSIQIIDGKFKYPLDASIQRETIEQVVLSIVDNRLRKQKAFGEQLILNSSIGFEQNLHLAKGEELLKWDKNGGNDLPFYNNEGRILKNGTKVTSAQKVKIAIQGNFKTLLNSTDVKDLAAKEQIEHLQALNKLIKDEQWLDKNGIREFITLTSDKIPIQNHNSQEFLEVYEFLPEEAGQLVVVSPALVAKSGADFDWDKWATIFPRFNITSDGTITRFNTNSEDKIRQTYYSLVDEFKRLTSPDTDVNKLISSLFGVSNDETNLLEEGELSNEIFGKDKVPSFNTFKRTYVKAYINNQINNLTREVLEKPILYQKLVTPNDTYLFEGIADTRKEALQPNKPSYSDIPTPTESLNQFESNTVGRQSLGIGALWNKLFARLQRNGMYLNDTYTTNPNAKKPTYRTTSNRLPHNTTKTGNITISGIFDSQKQYRISEVISQLMNGWVDVAKKDWVFYINGIRDVAPVMLNASIQGVNKDTLVAFFNQPVLYDYIKSLHNYKSSIVQLKDKALYQNAKKNAIFETLLKYIPIDHEYTYKDNKGISRQANTYNTLNTAFRQETQPWIFWNFLSNQMRNIADQNKDLFNPKYFTKFAIPTDGKLQELTSKDHLGQALYLIQYLEFEEQKNIIDNLRRAINQDTSKPENIQDAEERIQLLHDLKEFKLFPDELIDKIANESSVSAFTNNKNGIDSFITKLTKNMFEVTNHPLFNNFLKAKWENDKNIPFEIKYEIRPQWVKTFKNDFIAFLYQNYIYKPQENVQRIVDYVLPLMRYDTALAKQLENIKTTFPEIAKNNQLLQFLVRDNSTKKSKGKPETISLKLRKDRIDTNTSDILTQDFNKLLNFQDTNYSPEQQVEIQQFAKNLAWFAFIQSGLNKSNISFSQIIPTESYSNDISDVVRAYTQFMTNKPTEAQAQLQSFYNLFKKNNFKFYEAKDVTDDFNNPIVDENNKAVKDIEFQSESYRFKDYRRTNVPDILSKKANIEVKKEQEFSKTLISKTSKATEIWTDRTAKDNPKTFFIFEDNENRSGLIASAKVRENVKNPQPNTLGITLMKLASTSRPDAFWSDANYTSNIAKIDESLSSIISTIKELNPTQIQFPTNLLEASKLNEKAPNTALYLKTRLNELFGFNLENVNLAQDWNESKPLDEESNKDIKPNDEGKDTFCP